MVDGLWFLLNIAFFVQEGDATMLLYLPPFGQVLIFHFKIFTSAFVSLANQHISTLAN
jgi:hypothetical protein